jgi:16S rRNA (uracil1498-N3)-methyltransferase
LRINRIFTPEPLSKGSTIELDAGASLHLIKVLRLKPESPLELFNGDGFNYRGKLLIQGKRVAAVRIESCQLNGSESPLRTRLGIVISKGDRMDFVVQKSTELGIFDLFPLTSERCDIKLSNERGQKKREHWQKVAIAASEQCGRSVVPTIHEIQPLSAWIGEIEADTRLVMHHRASNTSLPQRAQSVALLIGPEGGLTEAEVSAAVSHGFEPFVLGPRVLRTETAPIAALSILQTTFGDFTI